MDFKNANNALVQKEFKQVKEGLLKNPDKAANLILNFYCDMFNLDIDFQTHALKEGLEIKNLQATRELPPAANFEGTGIDTMKTLDSFKTEKDYKDFIRLKIKGEKDDN